MNVNLKQQWFSCPSIKGTTPLRTHSYNYNTMSVAGAEDRKTGVGT